MNKKSRKNKDRIIIFYTISLTHYIVPESIIIIVNGITLPRSDFRYYKRDGTVKFKVKKDE